MKRLIVRKEFDTPVDCMARVGFVPVGTTNTVEVYVWTNDPGKTPHFHVRKYGKNGHYEWETCIRYDSAEYFLHGRHKDKLPDRKIAKQLDEMLRHESTDFEGKTYWDMCIYAWNSNNSSVRLDPKIEQPDYTRLV